MQPSGVKIDQKKHSRPVKSPTQSLKPPVLISGKGSCAIGYSTVPTAAPLHLSRVKLPPFSCVTTRSHIQKSRSPNHFIMNIFQNILFTLNY